MRIVAWLLVGLGVVRLFGVAVNDDLPGDALLLTVVLIVGGLLLLSLERIRDVLVESQDIARDTLAIEVAEADQAP